MRDLERVRVMGPLALYVNGFREEFERSGYSPFAAIRYLQLMGNLSRWLADSGLDDEALTTQALDAYAAWRRKAHYRGFSTIRSMAPLVEYLRGRGVVPPAVLVRLGLRAGEVAGLGLHDVDWPLGQVTIRGKGNRIDVLSSPVDVGEAVVAYLQNGHPGSAVAGTTVFARVRAPHGQLARGP